MMTSFLVQHTILFLMVALCVAIGLPLWGLHGRRIAWMLLWQLVCLVVGAIIGFTLIGDAVFEASGGCAGNGGGFEGACGYAGIADKIIWAAIAGVVAPLIGGLALRGLTRLDQSGSYQSAVDSEPHESRH